jgi:lipocalin
LSRKPVVSDEIFEKVLQVAKSKGFDITAMKPVAQKGCIYD